MSCLLIISLKEIKLPGDKCRFFALYFISVPLAIDFGQDLIDLALVKEPTPAEMALPSYVRNNVAHIAK